MDAQGNVVVSAAGEKEKSGVVYLSRIPSAMTPNGVRCYLEPFGKIGRVFLAPNEKTLQNKKMISKGHRNRRRADFTEGWVEFLHKKNAKNVALALNGTSVGGKKSHRFHDDIWNIKYLRGFKWGNLNEEEIYKRAVRQQKLQAEISQARKANAHYTRQVERAQEMQKIEEKRAATRKHDGDAAAKSNLETTRLETLRNKFRQRKPVTKLE